MAADELATTVDEHDQVIGSKPRRELTHGDVYRVASLWLTNSKGEILMARRAFTKSNNPGKWGPAAAGTVEPGETYEQNIYKEAEEEVGLTGAIFQLGPKVLINGDDGRQFFVQWFTAESDWPLEKFTIREAEVAQIAWVPGDRLRQELDHNPEKYTPSAPKWVELFL